MVLFRKTSIAVWGTAVCLLVMASSCLKSIDTTNSNNNKRAFISLLHLAPSGPSLEVYLNDNKSSAAILPGAISSAYSAITPGMFTIALKKAGSDSVVASLPALVYDSLQFYTLLIYNDQPTTVKAVRIFDDFSVISGNSAYYRFFQMSPNLGMDVDLYMDNVKIESSRQYADNVTMDFYNEFFPKEAGNHSFQVRKAGTDSLIVQSNTTLTERNAFTIILKGMAPTSPATTGTLQLTVLQAAN
jgi:hypothetical protein